MGIVVRFHVLTLFYEKGDKMLTQEQVNELLESAKPSIIEGLKRDISNSVTYTMKENAGQVIREHVTEWIKNNVIPEITKQLIEGKEGLIKAGFLLAESTCNMLMESMVKDLGKRLQNDWERKKILEAMFN
jgi:uncharacterized membrane-anchored protein YjiN (DUF445 family)